jgi:hypothetical protein
MPRSTKKECQSCHVLKPLSEYYHNDTKPDKHNGICKDCQAKSNQKNRG